MAYGDICALCKHREIGGLHPDPDGGNVEVIIIRRGEKFHLCDACVKEIYNAERRRQYARRHWARNQLKALKKFENQPSRIDTMTY